MRVANSVKNIRFTDKHIYIYNYIQRVNKNGAVTAFTVYYNENYTCFYQSPRRAEILRSAGVSFEIMPAGIDETVSALSPSEAVCKISRRKAEYIADLISDGGAFIISADTVVCTGAALADDACSPDGIRCSDSAYTTGGTCSPDGTYSPSENSSRQAARQIHYAGCCPCFRAKVILSTRATRCVLAKKCIPVTKKQRSNSVI